MKKVLLISASAGAGHVRAAEAIKAALQSIDSNIRVPTIDCLRYTPITFRKLYAGSYMSMMRRAPFLWGFLYSQSDRQSPEGSAAKFRRFVQKINARAMIRYIRDEAPDHILCTHFLPAEVLSKLKARHAFHASLSTVVTDYDIHSFWVHENTDRYYVANDEVKWILQQKGIPAERIAVTGIPVHPLFTETGNGAGLISRLSLDPDVLTVLVTSGGYGVGPIEDGIKAIMGAAKPLQVLVVAGHNKRLERRLSRLRPPDGVKLISFGYVDNMHELMDMADIAVTKAGGLTSAECLAKGLPMLIVSAIPGQEERNSDFLLEAGAALRVRSPESLAYKLRFLAEDCDRLQGMKDATRRVGSPNSARIIAEDLLSFIS